MDGAKYKEVLDEVLGLKEGDPVAVSYKGFAHAPTPPHGFMARVPTIGAFVRWAGDCIVFKSLGGALYIDPLDEVYISSPNKEEYENLVRKVEAERGGRRIAVVGPDGEMPR